MEIVNKIFRYKKESVALFLLFLNLFVWHAVLQEDREGIMMISFMDVGQGDAIYIESPSGNQIVLDAGPDRTVLRRLPYLLPFYDRSIDLALVSHVHTDHINGFLDLFLRYNFSGVLWPGIGSNTFQFKNWEKLSKNETVNFLTLNRGQIVDLGDGVILEVLLPVDGLSQSCDVHECMLVVKLVYGETSFLLTGDMEKELEKYLTSVDGGRLKSNVLKSGHHGSNTSTSDLFLSAVSPEFVVISSGKGNRYGHPHKEVLDRVEKFGSKILRTDTDGTITFRSDGQKIWLEN